MEETMKEKIAPVKDWLRWWIALGIVAILGVFLIFYGNDQAYKEGYRDGVIAEKIGDLEDVIFNNQEVKRGKEK